MLFKACLLGVVCRTVSGAWPICVCLTFLSVLWPSIVGFVVSLFKLCSSVRSCGFCIFQHHCTPWVTFPLILKMQYFRCYIKPQKSNLLRKIELYFPEGTEATSGWISPCGLFKHTMMLYKLKTEGKFLSATEEMSLRGEEKKKQITPIPFHWCLKGKDLIVLNCRIKLISKRSDIPITWPLLCSSGL